MSQQTATRPGHPPPPGAEAAAHAGPAPDPRGRGGLLGPLTRGSTPAALARLRVASAVVVLVATVVSAVVLVVGWDANRAAAADTEQLIRAQAIKTDLLRADALATNAFLVGGLESATQRSAYDDALTSVTEGITAASEAQPADQVVLARLNAAVLAYASTMELARANNRQGLPVGGAYLRQASGELRSTALPLTDALVAANAERAESAMDGQHPWLLVLPAALAVVLLFLVNRWIAARFRRHVNVGLAVAALVVLGAGVVAVAAAGTRAGDNAVVRGGSYAVVVDGAAARTAANDAKSDESLRLIARGSGQAFEDAWTAAAAEVDDALVVAGNPAVRAQWQAYVDGHAQVVALDAGGSWDDAVELATTTGSDGTTAVFTEFDTAMAQVVSDAADSATGSLRGGTWLLLAAAGLWVALGLLATGAAWRGVSVRMGEYS
jgi:hypothetical protein